LELALRNLSPSDPRTLEIARLVLAYHPAPQAPGAAAAAPGPVNATFSLRKTQKQGTTTYTSPVEIAAHQWSPEGVRLLLDNGLKIPSQEVAGALVHAAANGCAPVITMLPDAGAAVDGRDRNNDTPLAMARRVRNPQIVALLVGRGARAEAPKQSAVVTGAQNAIANLILGGPTPPPPGTEGVVWIEGAQILAHPAGQAALRLAEAAPVGGPLPGADALRRGIEAGSVLAVKDSEAELHVVTFASLVRPEKARARREPRRSS
jgi:hypothetical protein